MSAHFARLGSTLLFVALLLQAVAAWSAEPAFDKSSGQTIYVPAYSHIYHGNKEAPLLLSVTLSIRNIDVEHELVIAAVDYYDTQGNLIRRYAGEPVRLGPLGTQRYIIPQKDSSGGSGANFIVTWQADRAINPPLVETVMIGTQSQLGISFTSRGRALQQ